MSHSLAVLISGSGSNLQALIDAIEHQGLPARIDLVLSNRADAGGLARAKSAGLATAVIDHRDHDSRESFDQAMVDRLAPLAPDTVVLAGFMRILTPVFVRAFSDRLLNIHPSLLPKYPGLHTHRRALDAGDSQHGCSIHFVTEELDGGPLIAQAPVPVLPNDHEETLSKRVQQAEHRLYPDVVRWRAERRLFLTANGVQLDDRLLPPTGLVVPDLAAGDTARAG
ncbi:phosphoribosylglycinamide formyltransferase [Isoalcanivorax beigongshangi]|uniref:Phosphoribosylglycinamide formyltransferase n=1 Tax=Isoalcanivorax beigongshangi TaxID=3238810 RepID=A0ABV4AGG4_9GAMM